MSESLKSFVCFNSLSNSTMAIEYCGTNKAADTAQDVETNTCQEWRQPPVPLQPQPAKGAQHGTVTTVAGSCSKACINKIHMGLHLQGFLLVFCTHTSRMTKESTGALLQEHKEKQQPGYTQSPAAEMVIKPVGCYGAKSDTCSQPWAFGAGFQPRWGYTSPVI